MLVLPTRADLEVTHDIVPRDAVVAIDGPAGSGKSTTAKALARRLGLVYVDTGAMYRALTLAAIKSGADLADGQALQRILAASDLRLESGSKESRVVWDGRDVSQAIRTPEVDASVSVVAAHGDVRRDMVERQRAFARRGAVVMEGRDIGSVVFPLATTKIFLNATLESRTERRWRQERERGREPDRQTVRDDLVRRDEIDSGREESPLLVSPDATVLDTSDWSLDRQIDEAVLACRINPWLDRRLDWDDEAAWRALPLKYRLVYNMFDLMARMVGQRTLGRPAPTIPAGVIVASNHVSWYDPPLVGATFRRGPIRSLAKRELFRTPLGRRFFRWLDAIPIDRRGYDDEAFGEARKALERGDNLFLFPEGTRRPPGQPGPIKGGLGILVQETEAPILPVFVRGTYAPRFGGNPESPLVIRFGPVVRCHALPFLRRTLDRKQITSRIGDMYLSMLKELQARSFVEYPETEVERELRVLAQRRAERRRPFG